jgi:hypothetical protein
MKSDFEYMRYSDNERLSMLETRAAEIERMLGSATAERGTHETADAPDYPADTIAHTAPPGYHQPPGYHEPAGYRRASGYQEVPGYPGGREYPVPFEYPADASDDDPDDGDPGDDDPGDEAADGRTEVLISRGRRNARPRRFGFLRAHWKAAAVIAGVLAALAGILSAVTSGGSATWPASVAAMQTEITTACENPNVAAEPSQVNFACAKDTQAILWVFALLTSGGNPGYVDQTTGRKGIEPITPAQGGDVAWSLNLHAPYDPSSATDSLEVAARAINNIISGATLTNASGTPSVQGGLESSAANCQRYTGSPALVRRSGYPAACAHGVTSASGQEALVSDVFRQWMVGAPAQLATDAGVLFVNAGDPGNPQVRQILETLPGSGL